MITFYIISFIVISVVWFIFGSARLSIDRPFFSEESKSVFKDGENEFLSQGKLSEDTSESVKSIAFILCVYCGPILWIIALYTFLKSVILGSFEAFKK